MKKFFMFLVSAAFITQVHAMNDNDVLVVKNTSAKAVTVSAVVTGQDGSRRFNTPIRCPITLDAEPGETTSYTKGQFRPEYKKQGVGMDRIEQFTVSLTGTYKSVELGRNFYLPAGETLTVTDDMLEKAN